jgi:hypothetical protein
MNHASTDQMQPRRRYDCASKSSREQSSSAMGLDKACQKFLKKRKKEEWIDGFVC